jgi:hypothetical protein
MGNTATTTKKGDVAESGKNGASQIGKYSF